MERRGIQNVVEVLDLVELIGVAIGEAARANGFQMKDLLAVLDKPEFRERLAAAIGGVETVPLEIADIDIVESFELGRRGLTVIEKIAAAFAKVA